MAEGDFRGEGHVFAGWADVDVPFMMRDDRIDLSGWGPFFIGGVGSSIMSWFVPEQPAWKIGDIVPFDGPNAEFLSVQFGYTDGQFNVLAATRDVMEPLVGKLSLIDAERPADLRVHIGDIARSKLRRYLHAEMWTRADRITKGHIELLNRMVTQFHVPPEEAMDTLERILQARPDCPLGGDYRRQEGRFFAHHDPDIIHKYEHPILKRLRGGEFELTIEGTTLISHAEVLLDLP